MLLGVFVANPGSDALWNHSYTILSTSDFIVRWKAPEDPGNNH